MRKRSECGRINRRQFVLGASTQAAGATLAATVAAGDYAAGADRTATNKQLSREAPGKEPFKSELPMRLHVLGSGCPDPTPQRYGSAFILEVGTDCVMIDCGPATTHKMVRMGIRPGKVRHLFFTHHHFDHNADFPCFALTRWDPSNGTEPPLKVYGPPPTRAFVERLLGKEGAFFDDWNARIKHPVSQEIHKRRGGLLPRPAPAIEASDVGPGEIAESDGWMATAARVHHVEPWLESLAYRFETDQGSIVFAGDCGDCKPLRELARGADTLVIACVCIGSAERYDHIITGTAEAAEIAQASGVRRVILSHAAPGFSRPGMTERAIADVARTYRGVVLFPEELTTVDLST